MRRIFFGLFLLGAPSMGWGQATDQTAGMFDVVAWTFTNPSISGNPYDLIATATFTHPTANDIVTELYYDGGDRWKLRFSGTARRRLAFHDIELRRRSGWARGKRDHHT